MMGAALIAAALSGGGSPPAPVAFGASLGTAATSTAASTLVLTTTADAPVGSTIIFYFDSHSASEPPSLPTDNSGTGVTWQASTSLNLTGRKIVYFADLTVALPAGTQITFTSAQVTRTNAGGFYVTGLTGGGVDTKSAAGTSGTSTTPSITSPTLAAGKEKFVLGVLELGSGGVGSDITEAAGWTTINGLGSTHWYLHLAYKIVAAATTTAETYAPTLANSRTWYQDIISMKAA